MKGEVHGLNNLKYNGLKFDYPNLFNNIKLKIFQNLYSPNSLPWELSINKTTHQSPPQRALWRNSPQ